MTITTNGLQILDYADRRAANAATLQGLAGGNVATDEGTIEGDLVTLITRAGNSAAEDVAAAYYASSWRTAKGAALDRHAELVIGPRRRATASLASGVPLTGTAAAVIPAGSAITPSGSTVRWLLVDDVTLDGSGEGEGDFEAETTGPLAAVAGTEWTISTPSEGWTGVDVSPTDAELGTDDELDEAYRARYVQAVRAGPIGRAVAKLTGVTLVTLLENATDIPDDYHGATHWSELLVVGGDDDEIAAAIHAARPPGIDLRGNTTVQIADDFYKGGQVAIRFSRPEEIELYVKVTVTKGEAYSKVTGPTAQAARAAAIKNAILTAGAGLNPGVDVSAFQLAAAAATAVPGIKSLAVLVGLTSPPALTEYEVAVREQAMLDSARIEVVE
jgi:uncharacterized phage protein gp47/JayE